MYRTDFWTLWEKARVGCFKRTASKHVYYLRWNRSPAQVGCMRQVLRAGALGRPRGSGWRGRWEGGSGWGTHVNPWLIHVSVWREPLQYCEVISLQLVKINEKKRKKKWPEWYHLPSRQMKLTDHSGTGHGFSSRSPSLSSVSFLLPLLFPLPLFLLFPLLIKNNFT